MYTDKPSKLEKQLEALRVISQVIRACGEIKDRDDVVPYALQKEAETAAKRANAIASELEFNDNLPVPAGVPAVPQVQTIKDDEVPF